MHLDSQNWRHLYWHWHDTIRIYVHPVSQFLQGSPLWQTDKPRYSVCNNRPHLRNYTAMRPSNIGCSSAQRIIQNKRRNQHHCKFRLQQTLQCLCTCRPTQTIQLGLPVHLTSACNSLSSEVSEKSTVDIKLTTNYCRI